MSRIALTVLMLVGLVAPAAAQFSAAKLAKLADDASDRYPQPVPAGQLVHSLVLQPVESKNIIGHVEALVETRDNRTDVIVRTGGFFGIGGRSIAVPLDAMAILGRNVEIVGFTPQELAKFPTFDGQGVTPVANGEIVKIGLIKPSH